IPFDFGLWAYAQGERWRYKLNFVANQGAQPQLDPPRPQHTPPIQAVLRPMLLPVVILRHRRHAGWQQHPWLLRGGEDVDVGRETIGIVQRAHAHEADRVAGTAVVTPQRDAAVRAAGDLLASAAVGRRRHPFGFAGQQEHPFRLDHRVERERAAGFALAPAAMAAVHEQRRGGQAIAHRATVAAAVENMDGCIVHRNSLRTFNGTGRWPAPTSSTKWPAHVPSPPARSADSRAAS